MGKALKKITALILCVMMIVPFMSFTISAENNNFKEYTVSADGKKRTSGVDTSRWASPNYSYIYESGDNIVIVDVNDCVSVTTYTKDFELVSEKTINFELPVFGGFYSGETFNYIVFGQSNEEEDVEKEVYRIVKYDKNFNKISHASILGSQCDTVEPFDAGSVAIAESGNELTIHTSRLRFTSDDGYNHQSQFTIVLDTSSMTPTNNLKLFQDNHVSHSFNQFVQYEDGNRVLLDHGDAYPRCILLSKYNGMTRYGYEEYTEVNLFDIPGETGANCTGVFLGGFEVSENNYIVSINTIDHSKATEYDSFNIYGLKYDSRDALLITVPKNSLNKESVNHIYLTDYIDNSKHATAPKLIKLSEKMFAVMWKEYDVIEHEYSSGNKYYTKEYNGIRYVIVTENGDKLTGIKSLGKEVLLSDDCQPLYTDQKIFWYYNTGSGERYICSIDISEEIEDIGCEHDIVCVPAKEASCTSVGNKEYYKCAICGNIYKDAKGTNKTTFENELIPLLPHQGGVSTCQSPGICTVCGTEYIPVSEHVVGDWMILTASSCKAQGERIKVCRICGETVEREMIPMAEHTPGDWVTVNNSTCNAEGKKVKICSACGDEVANETIPVKEHTPGNWEVTKKASCGVEGTESLKCSVCGYVISTRTVAALEHEESEEWFVNKPPTCSEEGIKQKKCIHCGKAMGAHEKIEKLPHKPGSYWINDIQPTCTEEGLKIKKCTVCGEVAEKEVIPANGHLSAGDWIIETYPSCDGAGRKVKYCSVCGEISQEILINPEGHSSSAEWFLRKEATCTEDGEYYKKCTVCGMDTETKSIDKLGHDLGEWSVTKPATCSEDGIKTRKCIRCDYSETEPLPSSGHDFEGEWKTTKPATCTENGIESLFCKNCSHSLTREIPATGHSAGEWEIIKKADCKNTGTQVKRCKNCNNIIYSETIPVSGHSAGNWIITKTPQNGNYGIKSKFCTGCGMKLEEKIIHSINNSVVRDAVTGIEIIYPEESFDGNIAMRAGFLSGSDLGNKVFNEIGKCTFKGYEATLIHNGEYVTPEKSYSLRLPLPDGMNHKTAEVYAIDMGSGRFVKVDASYENGYFLIDKVEAVQYVVIERIITLTLSEANLSLKKGDSVQIHAYTEGGNVTYTSSNSSVATVDIHGNIKAVGAGTATITATVDGTTVKAECSVEVTQSFFDMIIEAFTNFFKMIAELFGF